MHAAQDERTPEFTTGLADAEFAARFLASRLGSTTHIAVLDGEGRAATVTCTNGEGSAVIVPGSLFALTITPLDGSIAAGYSRHTSGYPTFGVNFESLTRARSFVSSLIQSSSWIDLS